MAFLVNVVGFYVLYILVCWIVNIHYTTFYKPPKRQR